MSTYALVSKTSNTVSNIIQSDQTLQELSDMLTNFTVVELTEGIKCAVSDYYNPNDGLFYIDPDFTWLSGTTPPPSLDDAYAAALKHHIQNKKHQHGGRKAKRQIYGLVIIVLYQKC